MRLAFMGTPDFAVPVLRACLASGNEVVAVYTRAPRPAGRGMGERKSPVHEAAEAAGIPVFTPRTLRDADAQAAFAAHDLDLAVVAAYGLILPKAVLDAPRKGCINLHASILPRWRGAAPIQRAIMAGDMETGVTVMQMSEGLDEGDMGPVARVTIGPETTAGELHDALAEAAGWLTSDVLAQIADGTFRTLPQPEEGVTYAAKIDKAEARIDWTRDAETVDRQIRGLSPFPGAWFELGGKERVKVLRSRLAEEVPQGAVPGEMLAGAGLTVACGAGAVRLLTLQRAGKQPVDAAAFLNGARLSPGDRLG
ncbi:methionyl-tRNA formyltransferase [Futiania mangrovi]|uniref:Methionyl-tRNA formyltransferase n=1 Tax=Futiania mangrovi TaxID=2959716 RepID=A0A9J6PM65_9PROT|nr:methionyl-tRNA formyltransferase [Futiania mangrovii]MCP1337759.1 methionyl-tRNA formyltransferase [Futiania mangrovii]